MKKLYNAIKNEYIFSVITKIIDMLIAVVQSILLARFLGASLKGTYTYIYSIISISSIVITFGFHQAYPYFRKKYGKDAIYDEYINAIYLVYFLYFALSLILSTLFVADYEIKLVFIFTPIIGYTSVVTYVCLIEQPNIRNLVWTITGMIEDIVLLILLLFAEGSMNWIAFILAFSHIIRGVIYTGYLNCRVHISKKVLTTLGKMYRIGFFPMLALLMTTLNYRIDVLMLRKYSYISSAQIGIYSIGISVADKIVLIPDTLKGVLVSKLSKGASSEEVVRVSRLCLWVSIVICLLFFAVGQWGIRLLYGAEYDGAYSVMLISAFGALAIGYFKLIGQWNIINRKQIYNVLMLSIAVAVDVIFNLLMIPVWGINGAAFATGIGNFICGLVFVIYFSKTTHTTIRDMIVLQKSDFGFIKKLIKRC